VVKAGGSSRGWSATNAQCNNQRISAAWCGVLPSVRWWGGVQRGVAWVKRRQRCTNACGRWNVRHRQWVNPPEESWWHGVRYRTPESAQVTGATAAMPGNGLSCSPSQQGNPNARPSERIRPPTPRAGVTTAGSARVQQPGGRKAGVAAALEQRLRKAQWLAGRGEQTVHAVRCQRPCTKCVETDVGGRPWWARAMPQPSGGSVVKLCQARRMW